MKKKNVQTIIYIAFISVLAILCIIMLTGAIRSGVEKSGDYVSIEPSVSKHSSSLFTEEEVVIAVDILNDGLNDMGTLVTAEYYFTNMETYTDTVTYLKFITSEKSFAYSYDGVVLAGVDFTKISVTKDDASKKISVVIPNAEIISVDIDMTSFKKYSEKNGLFNKIELEDYNESLVAFKDTAKKNAISKNILVNANKQAITIVRNFIKGIVGNEYTIEIR